MEPLPLNEFLEIYHRTGMDIDGRIWYIKRTYPEMEEACLKYIHYAQELSGFDRLSKEDQISILKGTLQLLNKTYVHFAFVYTLKLIHVCTQHINCFKQSL